MQPANGDGQPILGEPLCLRSQASPETVEERGTEDIDRGRKGETVATGFCWISIANLQLISYLPAYLPPYVLCTAYMVPEALGDFQTEDVSCHLSLREGSVNKESSHG